MMIAPHATKEDLLRLADIATFIQGYMTAMKVTEHWSLFTDEHYETLRLAYSLLQEDVRREDCQKKVFELRDEEIPF
jgi:hypothetical protein